MKSFKFLTEEKKWEKMPHSMLRIKTLAAIKEHDYDDKGHSDLSTHYEHNFTKELDANEHGDHLFDHPDHHFDDVAEKLPSLGWKHEKLLSHHHSTTGDEEASVDHFTHPNGSVLSHSNLITFERAHFQWTYKEPK